MTPLVGDPPARPQANPEAARSGILGVDHPGSQPPARRLRQGVAQNQQAQCLHHSGRRRGVRADRAAALREAFDAMSKNPRFLDEARRLHMDVQLGTGSEIETLVKEIYALPKAVIAVTKQAVTNGDAGR
jgi:hypothetical protein